MALSDREKAIFDNLVNGLEEDIQDPAVEEENKNYRLIILVVIGFILGIALMITAVITKLLILGLLGFVIMLLATAKGVSFIKW